MKTGFIASIAAVVLLLGVVVWGMGRITKLENEIAELKKAESSKSESAPRARPRPSGPQPARYSTKTEGGRRIVRDEPRDEGADQEGEKEPRTGEQALGDLIRAFAESDAGAALQNFGNRQRAGRVYDTLINEFGFNEEEKGYFLDIVGSGVGSNDALWSKLMGTKSKEDRYTVVQEYEAAVQKRESELREFLNNDQDYQRYQQYEARLEEYEQLPGLRSSMAAAGEPLTEEQESQLVEAMHEGRVKSGITGKWEGAGVMTQLEQPGMSDRLQEDWTTLQSSMNGGVSQVLTPVQLEAFEKNQAQTLQGLTMGIRFAEAAAGGGSQSEE